MKQTLALIAGPLAFLVIDLIPIDGLEPAAHNVLALTAWMAIWWVSEAIPMSATALLPVTILPLLQAIGLKPAAAVYSSPIIFLFLGGFAMALSIEKWGLHQRLALGIIKRTGSRSRSIVLGFILATALLSMWISNTATTLMLLPIALAMLKELDQNGSQGANGPFAQALLLGIAYSASIGGTATLIGTPTNLIFAAASDELLGRSVSFYEWTRQALPLALAALILCWLYLTRWKFRFEDRDQPELKKIVQQKLDALGPLSGQELKVLLVFSAVVVLWIGRTLLLQDLLPGLSDPAIALGGALILFILPSDRSKGRILEWSDMKELPWGILILFGGGLSLAAAFQATGLATWLADRFLFLEGTPPLLILIFLVASVNFTTELTSNVATASVLMPVLASLGASLGMDSFSLMFACAVTSSYAFMLPVATAPNAVVFSSGRIPIGSMTRAGLWLNLLSIALISAYHYLFLEL